MPPDVPPAGLLDLLLPRPCALCGAGGGPLCAGCRADLPVTLHDVPFLLRDGTPLAAAAALTYTGAARELLLSYKEGGRHELVPVLGELLAHACLGVALTSGRYHPDQPGPLVLVPVGSRPASRRSRGADVGVLLARQAAAVLRRAGHLGLVAPVLRHRRRSRDQAGLGRSARAGNVLGTLAAAADPLEGAPGRGRAGGPPPLVIVTDDILTTGATMREAARALAAVGRPATAAAVVAATVSTTGSTTGSTRVSTRWGSRAATRVTPLSRECPGG